MKNKLMGNDLWIFITKSGLTLSVNILKLDFAQNSFWPPPPSHLFARFECPPGKHFPHLSPNKSLHMKVKPETPVPPPSLVGTSVRKCVWCVCVWVFVRESVYMCECVCVYVCVCVFLCMCECVCHLRIHPFVCPFGVSSLDPKFRSPQRTRFNKNNVQLGNCWTSDRKIILSF